LLALQFQSPDGSTYIGKPLNNASIRLSQG